MRLPPGRLPAAIADGRSLIAVRRPGPAGDEDLDVGAQPAGLGGQILDLLAGMCAGGEQHDTPAHDGEIPAQLTSAAGVAGGSASIVSINRWGARISLRPFPAKLRARQRHVLTALDVGRALFGGFEFFYRHSDEWLAFRDDPCRAAPPARPA